MQRVAFNVSLPTEVLNTFTIFVSRMYIFATIGYVADICVLAGFEANAKTYDTIADTIADRAL